jgi:hypothetical protein
MPFSVRAATIYLASVQCSGTYNPSTNSCSGGSFNSWDTLGEIETNAAVGDTINICPGTYQAPSSDYVDLKANQTWQAATCGGSSVRPVLNCSTASGVLPFRGCLHGNNDDNVTIAGLQFDNCQQSCIRDVGSAGWVIRDNVFNNWRTTGSFEQGMQAAVFVLDTEQALIEFNKFVGSATLSPQAAIKGGFSQNNNACGFHVRYNTIDGQWPGSGERVGIQMDVHCGSTSKAGGRNIIEYNYIDDTSTAFYPRDQPRVADPLPHGDRRRHRVLP